MTYQLTQGDCIQRLSDSAFIPPDPANTDYAAYLAWKAAGNTPEPAPEPEPVPEPTAAEKLAAAGLTVAELRELLGLNTLSSPL
jgi:hypothetical protein